LRRGYRFSASSMSARSAEDACLGFLTRDAAVHLRPSGATLQEVPTAMAAIAKDWRDQAKHSKT
jgi:hypothetical protein